MRWMKWVGLAAAIVLIASCFLTWVVIESRGLVISGMNAQPIGLGRPGYLHLVFIFCFVLLSFIPRVWAKRLNLPVTALNVAWAIRNYFVVATCSWGECPDKQPALYLLVPAAVIMLVSALLPDLDIRKKPGS